MANSSIKAAYTDGCLRFSDEVEIISLVELEQDVNVKKIDFNNVKSIIASAHAQGFNEFFPNLEEVTAPQIKKVNNFLFSDCIHLNSVSLEKAEEIGVETFYGCKSLKTINLPNAITIESEAFLRSGLEYFESPVTLKLVGSKTFARTALKEINLKNVEMVRQEAFKECHELKIIKARSTSVFSETFSLAGIYNLETLILDLPNNTDNYPFVREGKTYTVKDLMTGRIVRCISGPIFTKKSKRYVQRIPYGEKGYIYTLANGNYAIDDSVHFEWNIPLKELDNKLKAM